MNFELELVKIALRLTPAQLKHLYSRVKDNQSVCWHAAPLSPLTVAVCDRLDGHDGEHFDSRLKAVMRQSGIEVMTIGRPLLPLGNVSLEDDDRLWMLCETAHRLHLRQLPLDLQPEIDRVCNGRSPDQVFNLVLKDGRKLEPTPDNFKLLYSLGWHEALADRVQPFQSRLVIPGVN